MEAKHATLSASGAARWRACPGSPREEAKYPESRSSEYAKEGTAAHNLGERVLKFAEDLDWDASRLIGVTLDSGWKPEDKGTHQATEEMAEAVQVYVDQIRKVLAELRVSSSDLLLEQRLVMPLGEKMFGTTDALIPQDFGALYVGDYKHGQGVAVDPVTAVIENGETIKKPNDQLAYYGYAACDKYGWEHDPIILEVIQPRATHPDGPVRRHVMTQAEMRAWGEALEPDIEATKDPNAPLFAGDHCRWCRAKANCPAQRAKVEEVAKLDFSVIPKDQAPVVLAVPDDMQILLNVLHYSEMIKGYLSACHAYAQEVAETGVDVPGWKLVAGRSHRKWTDTDKVVSKLKGMKLKADEIFKTPTLRSPAQIEKVLKETRTGARKEAKNKKFLAEFVVKPAGKKTLVKVSDARGELAPSAQTDFEVIAPAQAATVTPETVNLTVVENLPAQEDETVESRVIRMQMLKRIKEATKLDAQGTELAIEKTLGRHEVDIEALVDHGEILAVLHAVNTILESADTSWLT